MIYKRVVLQSLPCYVTMLNCIPSYIQRCYIFIIKLTQKPRKERKLKFPINERNETSLMLEKYVNAMLCEIKNLQRTEERCRLEACGNVSKRPME